MSQTLIIVTFRFEGFHQYKDAPEPVAYLRDLHRHEFRVRASIEVFHDDRELEFMMVKKDLIEKIDSLYPDKKVGSCEMVAEDLVRYIKAFYGSERYVEVEVFEDGENGARVIRP